MKYFLMILCASLLSVLALAADGNSVDDNPGVPPPPAASDASHAPSPAPPCIACGDKAGEGTLLTVVSNPILPTGSTSAPAVQSSGSGAGNAEAPVKKK